MWHGFRNINNKTHKEYTVLRYSDIVKFERWHKLKKYIYIYIS